jgi:hypothetical protein
VVEQLIRNSNRRFSLTLSHVLPRGQIDVFRGEIHLLHFLK